MSIFYLEGCAENKWLLADREAEEREIREAILQI